MATTYPASEKQLSFLTTLLAERDVPAELRSALSDTTTLTSKEASASITKLLTLPRAPKVVVTEDGPSPLAQYIEALAGVEKSFYAVPVSEVKFALTATQTGDNDLIFFEVREYLKRRFARRVHGAPGGFTRSKFTIGDAITLLKWVARDPQHYAELFAEKHEVCGKCGADLTDPVSRELRFGPECRKAFGL
jgi:Family of unknown function (DUF6011)